MITYDWNCSTMDVYPQNGEHVNLVYNVHWIVTGVSDDLKPDGTAYSITNIGTQVLDVSDVTEFILFEDLTNEQVVSWTQEAMGEEKVSSIESRIESNINSLIKPTTVKLTIKNKEIQDF